MKHLIAALLLLTTTFFWGVTFTVVKEAIGRVDVFVFLSQRFLLATGLMLPLLLFRHRHLTRQAVRHGIIMGLFLFGAYAFQTMALKYTSASNTGFLTGLNVVMVPIIGAILYRQAIPGTVRTGVLLAVAGLFLLCTNGRLAVNTGDLLATICAVSVSLHLILTGRYSTRNDVYTITTIQLGTVALLSMATAGLGRHQIFAWHSEITGALVVCALFATVLAFLVQTSMQRFISPSQTALIFCTEPVFAALYAWWAAGERLGIPGLVGALLILAGMVVSELRPTVKSATESPLAAEN